MWELFGLVVAVAIVVYILGLLPIPAPFNQIIMVVGILVVIVAALQFLFGVNLFGTMSGGRLR